MENNFINNENDVMIAYFPENTTKEERSIIVHSAEAFSLIKKFVENVKKGVYKPRATVNEFEQLLYKAGI